MRLKTHRYKGKLRAAIFDWAGTTVDFGSCAPVSAFKELFHSKGIDITSYQARLPMGLEKKQHIQALLQMPEISLQWQTKWSRPWDQDDVENLYRQFIPIQLACLKNFSKVIPGTLEAVQTMKRLGMKIGTTTGYNADMIGIVAEEAKLQGFNPDTIVCSNDALAGRPHPWMAYEVVRRLQIYPLEAYVKIGDTLADIHEGLNAGMWTIGVTRTGNELGLSEIECERLESGKLNKLLTEAENRFYNAGAHYVVDSVKDSIPILDLINSRLAEGEKP